MSTEPEQASTLDFAHVLFMDIVGYSKLPTDEQRGVTQRLNQLVGDTVAFKQAEALNELICLPTGDGIALVFLGDPEAPLRCAIELSRALRQDSRIKLRMGIHSGPVYLVADINKKINATGAGMNVAQRVMDCGDAGHILVSAAAADTLSQLSSWSGNLHDLGECEVKHGVKLHLFNIHADHFGKPELPSRLAYTDKKSEPIKSDSDRKQTLFGVLKRRNRTAIVGAGAVTLMLSIVVILMLVRHKQPTGRFSSLAVLPFNYQSKEMEYLADGIPESITYSLVKLPTLSVIPHSTTLRYKGQPLDDPQKVGSSLHAQALLTGNVRKGSANNTVSVFAELIDVGSGTHLEAWNFPDLQLSEVGQIEQNIAQEIPEKLSLNLSAAEKALLRKGTTENPEANRLYQLGRSYWNNSRKVSDLETAKKYFEEAIGKDPNFARAYAKLADSLTLINVYGTSSEALMLDAKKAAEKALQIDDNLAEAHTSLAYYYFRYEWNWPGAEKEFARSIKLDPDYPTARDWYADFLEAMGRTDEAIKQMKKALELDPADITLNADLGLAFCYAHQNEEAIKQLSKTLEMDTGADKGRLAQAHNYLGLTYEQQENFALASSEYEKAYNLDNSLRFHAIQARGYALSGKIAQAQQILDELSKNKDAPIFYLALLHAALGKPDNIDTAFTLLNKAIENKAPAVAFLKIDPRLDNLRKDHRFEDLLRRVNL